MKFNEIEETRNPHRGGGGLISSVEDSTILTLKIINGILKSITIRPPIAKFLSLSKFIELDIELKEVSMGDPIKNVNRSNFILIRSISKSMDAKGIIIKKGI